MADPVDGLVTIEVVNVDRVARRPGPDRRFDRSVDVARDVRDDPQLRSRTAPQPAELLERQQAGLRRFPIGAVDQHRQVMQPAGNAALEAFGMTGKFLDIDRPPVEPPVAMIALELHRVDHVSQHLLVFQQTVQLFGSDLDRGESLDDLERSPGHVSRTGEAADHGAHGVGNSGAA